MGEQSTSSGLLCNATTVVELVRGSEALLRYCAEHPLSPVTEAYRNISLTAAGGTKAKDYLTDNQLAIAHRVRLYQGKGGQVVLLELTQKGREHLASTQPEAKPQSLPGKGSLEHRVHAELVKRHFQQRGFLVKTECHEADLGLEKDGTWTAVEIANKNSRNLVERIEANRNKGATKTIVVCSDTSTAKRWQKALGNILDVEVQDVDPYLPGSTKSL